MLVCVTDGQTHLHLTSSYWPYSHSNASFLYALIQQIVRTNLSSEDKTALHSTTECKHNSCNDDSFLYVYVPTAKMDTMTYKSSDIIRDVKRTLSL